MSLKLVDDPRDAPEPVAALCWDMTAEAFGARVATKLFPEGAPWRAIERAQARDGDDAA